MEEQEILKAAERKNKQYIKRTRKSFTFFRQQHWVQDNYAVTFSKLMEKNLNLRI